MRIITFQGGLGNQLFQYVFYLWLKKNTKNKRIWGYYPISGLKGHNGLEIEEKFKVKLPASNKVISIYVILIKALNVILPKWKLISNDYSFDINSILYEGYWQDISFLIENFNIEFILPSKLDLVNEDLKNKILKMNSVSIHVRCGDYLSPKYVSIYGGICTIEYYKRAIEYIIQTVDNPTFFVFSDDIEWVKNNITVNNAIFVSNNNGINSFLDMYLMSICKHNIIANSSFSWWGAYLNKNKNKIVIMPNKWFNSKLPDPNVFDNKWLKLSNE